MERELSFEADSVNIYDNNESGSTEFLHTTKSKTQSCLKNTKESTNKSHSKDYDHS